MGCWELCVNTKYSKGIAKWAGFASSFHPMSLGTPHPPLVLMVVCSLKASQQSTGQHAGFDRLRTSIWAAVHMFGCSAKCYALGTARHCGFACIRHMRLAPAWMRSLPNTRIYAKACFVCSLTPPSQDVCKKVGGMGAILWPKGCQPQPKTQCHAWSTHWTHWTLHASCHYMLPMKRTPTSHMKQAFDESEPPGPVEKPPIVSCKLAIIRKGFAMTLLGCQDTPWSRFCSADVNTAAFARIRAARIMLERDHAAHGMNTDSRGTVHMGCAISLPQTSCWLLAMVEQDGSCSTIVIVIVDTPEKMVYSPGATLL